MLTYKQCPLLLLLLCVDMITKKQWSFFPDTKFSLDTEFVSAKEPFSTKGEPKQECLACIALTQTLEAFLCFNWFRSLVSFSRNNTFLLSKAAVMHRFQSTSGAQGTLVSITMASSEAVAHISSSRGEPKAGSLRSTEEWTLRYRNHHCGAGNKKTRNNPHESGIQDTQHCS